MTSTFTLRYALERMLRPFLFQADLTAPAWKVTALAARGWLLAAVASDLFAQFLWGNPTPLKLAGSALTGAIFWFAPRVLTGAISAVYVTQCLGSIGLLVGLEAVHSNQWVILVSSYVWQLVGLSAVVKVVLTYISTPKDLMR